jgi:hypothetical protein
MGRIESEKDLERGVYDDEKIAGDEKGGVFESQQSSPTLTQGTTFEDSEKDKGMHWNLGTGFDDQ